MQVNDHDALPDIEENPLQGAFRWVYACRQLKWCSRCSAIEREAKAIRFAKATAKHAAGSKIWGIVISPKRPDCVQGMLGSAELMGSLLSQFSLGFVRSKQLDPKVYVCGMHTQPQEGGTLWPHLHSMMLTSPEVSKQLVSQKVDNWLSGQSITGVKVSVQMLGTVGYNKHEEDLKRLFQYITRHDDPEDNEYHPTVRHVVQQSIGTKRTYCSSVLPGGIKRKRTGFPNASVQRKWLRMMSATFDAGCVKFVRSDAETPADEADLLYSQCAELFGIKHG